jgi:hypothetical protein
LEFILDVVVPVKMPTDFLTSFKAGLGALNHSIRINYVLDIGGLDNENESKFTYSGLNERTISGNFGSPGKARNAALGNLDAKYLCFWDIDDSPVSSEFLNLIILMEESNADVGIGNWSYLDSPDKLEGISPLDVAHKPGIWRFIFKQECVSQCRFIESLWGEDQLYLHEVFLINPKVVTSDRLIYKYRRYAHGSLTANKNNAPDLFEVLRRGIPLLGKLYCPTRGYFFLIYCRQILTLIKHRKILYSLKAILLLIRSYGFRNNVFRDMYQLLFGRKTWVIFEEKK